MYIYAFFFEGNLVKVGRSSQPFKRLKQHEKLLKKSFIRGCYSKASFVNEKNLIDFVKVSCVLLENYKELFHCDLDHYNKIKDYIMQLSVINDQMLVEFDHTTRPDYQNQSKKQVKDLKAFKSFQKALVNLAVNSQQSSILTDFKIL